MPLPFVEGKIRMTHSALAGVEVYETQAAYRAAWYDAGWRSIDDPTFTGNPSLANRRFMYTPTGWGDQWRRARTEAASRLVKVAVYGASTTVGENSTDQKTKSFQSLTRAAIQAAYGDGGSGLLGPANRTNGSNPGAGPVTQTGSWTDVNNEGGLLRLSVRPTTPGNGATMTFPVRGTTVNVYTRTDPTYGSWTWTIDSNSQTAIALNETAAIKKTTVTGLAPGNHTVVITASTGDGRLIGVEGLNTTGVAFENLSVSGQTFRDLSAATSWGTSTDPVENSVIGRSLDAIGPVDLVITCLGVNEVIGEPPPTLDALYDALDVIYTQIVQSGPAATTPPEIVNITEHVGKADIVTGFSWYQRDWIQFSGAMRLWCTQIGAANLDVWAMGHHSWDYWDSLDYWANPNGAPDSGEPIHLHDNAHAAIADPLIELLTQA